MKNLSFFSDFRKFFFHHEQYFSRSAENWNSESNFLRKKRLFVLLFSKNHVFSVLRPSSFDLLKSGRLSHLSSPPKYACPVLSIKSSRPSMKDVLY